MKVSIAPDSGPAQARQVKQQLRQPDESLSYELGKAVQELPPLYTRLLAAGISLLVFGALGWAHFSKIDEVAVAQGELVPNRQVRPIRALSPGSVSDIKVRQGEQVEKGEVLLLMNPGVPKAEVGRLENAAKLVREDIARLEAELAGTEQTGTPLQDQLLAARLRQFDTQRAAALAEANREQATIREGRSRLERFQENVRNGELTVKNAAELLANAQERERSLRVLLEDSAVPRLDYLDAKSQVTQAQDRLTEARDRLVTLQKELDSQRERIRQSEAAYQAARSKADGLESQRRSEILTQLTKRREELSNIEGQLQGAKKEQERETLTAPFDGVVYNIKATQGPVQSGEELLSLLPKGEDILLEVKVLNRDIGFIKEGMRAKVKLATFPYQEFGIVEGEVVWISPNAITQEEVGLVFPTLISLNRDALNVRGKAVEFTPGMAGSAEIVTRRKSILTFLIEPVTRRFNDAFSVR